MLSTFTSSIHRKILLPLTAVGLVSSVTLLAMYVSDARTKSTQALTARAVTLTNTISHAAHTVDGIDQLNRFINLLANEDDVAQIVIAADSPARIVAASHNELRNAPLATLADSSMSELLRTALTTSNRVTQFDPDRSLLAMATPIELALTNSLPLNNNQASVLVYLNSAGFKQATILTSMKTVFAAIVVLTMLAILCWWLLNHYVVKPTGSLAVAVKANLATDTSICLPDYAPIELINVARQLDESFKAVRAAESQARSAMAAKGEFLARMSHEIRTPMNGVMGMMEAMLATPLNHQQSDFMKTAYSSASSLLRLINDILDYSKIEAGKLVIEQIDFDVHALISQIVQLWGKRAEDNGVEFSMHIDTNVVQFLRGDPTRLNQILTNLVSNALKFTPQGKVDLRIELATETDDIVVIKFVVEDTGLGMSDETQKLLFSAFTQADGSTSRRFGGTGLGLAICAQLLQLMHGTVNVKSAVGSGTRFEVILPFKRGNANKSSAAPGQSLISVASRNGITGKLLVVDDNETNRKVIQIMLERLNIECDCAHDGMDAISDVKTRDYVLVLMDCHMPVFDGFEATTAIRRWEQENHKPRMPIIAVTASAFTEDRERCTAAGMDDFLAKPVTFAELVSALDRWLPLAQHATAAVVSPHDSSATTLSESQTQSLLESPTGTHSDSFDIDSELFDAAQLAEALDLFGGELHDILDHLQRIAAQAFSDIDKAIAEANGVLIKDAAHKLKGSLATLGSSKAANTAFRLETLGRMGELQDAAKYFEQLKNLYERTYQRLLQLAGPRKPKAPNAAAR